MVPHVEGACNAHRVWPLPAGTGEHVPFSPTRLHDRQGPPQAVLQQTPSAQFSDAQSESPIGHRAPFIFLPQVPFTHRRPSTQSLSVPQVAKHWFVLGLQENGAQTVDAPS